MGGASCVGKKWSQKCAVRRAVQRVIGLSLHLRQNSVGKKTPQSVRPYKTGSSTAAKIGSVADARLKLSFNARSLARFHHDEDRMASLGDQRGVLLLAGP